MKCASQSVIVSSLANLLPVILNNFYTAWLVLSTCYFFETIFGTQKFIYTGGMGEGIDGWCRKETPGECAPGQW